MDSDLLSNASNIAVCVSAVAVAIIAFIGVTTWRRELKGKAKFEVARSVHVLCRRIQSRLEWATFPMTVSGESSERPRLENESVEASRVLDQLYARGQRLKPLMQDLRELQEASWEAEAVLDERAGNEVVKVFALLNRKRAHIKTGIDEYFELLLDETKGRDISMHREWLKQLRKEIYSTKEDDFSKEINDAIDNLASLLKPYLRYEV